MKRTILLSLMFACGAALAAEWASLGKTNDGKLETFADVSDIKVAGNIRRVWLKGVNAPHSVKGVGSDSGKWMTYFLNRYAFNCDDETVKIEAITNYYDDGTNTKVSAVSIPASWDPVVPESTMHVAMDFTCSWKP